MCRTDVTGRGADPTAFTYRALDWGSVDGTARFPRLFSPLALRNVTIANRTVMLPMGSRFGENGGPSRGCTEFWGARAAGGVGLLITGGTNVHPSSAGREHRSWEAFDPEIVAKLRPFVARIHGHGTKLFGQLMHLGREAPADGEWPAWAPSAITSPRGVTPHAMSRQEIDAVVDGFALSAGHLREAGYDGIEIHAAHGYLVAQFLSPRTNARTDRYGGSTEGRATFLVDVIGAIRDRIGNDCPLGVRISADEEVPDGLRIEESARIARILAATGHVDYISVAVGVVGAYVKDMSWGVGGAAEAAAAIKKASGLPVIASQRITHPTMAESILDSGAADLTGMARALIADPDWVKKARAGDLDRILPCVGAIQECRERYWGCLHNAESGRETMLGALRGPDGTPAPRRVVVVGGGPAGLEAARIAATRGHRVTVLEREHALGGQVNLAARVPSRTELHGIVEFRVSELRRLGVEVRTGVCATADLIVAERPDAVVVATGARPRRPAFEGADLPSVLTVWDLLADPAAAMPSSAGTAVVVDDGSGTWEALESAELLGSMGVRVELVTHLPSFGGGIPPESVGPMLRRLKRYEVRLHPLRVVLSAAPGTVTLCDPVATQMRRRAQTEEVAADIVVVYAGRSSDRTLVDALAGKVPALHEAGDCISPRRIGSAVLDGYRAAYAI